MADRPGKRSRVPASRLERLVRFGFLAGEMAAGGLYEGARRAVGVSAGAAGAASALLAPAQAQRLARRLSQMRGAAMKLGQLLSLEGDDLLPPEFAEALAVLRATPGYWTLSASCRPSEATASWTWPIEAEAIGSKSNWRKRSSHPLP